MYPTTLICLALVASFCGVTSAQVMGRYRPVVPVAAPVVPSCGCNNACPDICTLIQLANALNGQSSASSSGLNVDDMITKLLDALLTATVGGSGSGSCSGSSGSKGSTGSTGSSSTSANPIIGLNLLGPNGLIAGLGLGGTKVLDVSAGGQNPDSGLNGLLENLVGGSGL